jgi:hypothetical protein
MSEAAIVWRDATKKFPSTFRVVVLRHGPPSDALASTAGEFAVCSFVGNVSRVWITKRGFVASPIEWRDMTPSEFERYKEAREYQR